MTQTSSESGSPGTAKSPHQSLHNTIGIVVNVVIGILLFIAGYLTAEYVPSRGDPGGRDTAAVRGTAKVLQCDVLNGCGVRGVSAKFTAYLRSKGFDVVEMKNYKTFGIAHTIVVDRVGDLSAARRIAAALGVPASNIIQQLNPDYFVDVSVIIGADYSRLNVSQ